MKQLLLMSTLVGLFALQSVANSSDDPGRWHNREMAVFLHNSDKQFNTVVGNNPLDRPRTITCKSVKGCLISFEVWADASDNGVTVLSLCALLDGNPAPPACPRQSDFIKSIRQSAKVSQGAHTVQTAIIDSNGGGTVYAWEADYTVYEK